MRSFMEKLDNQIDKKKSLLCIGLDTDYDKLQDKSKNIYKSIMDFNEIVIDETKDLAVCYKINSAFYEKYGADGLHILKRTVEYIGKNIPVILDAKRADIGNSSNCYAQYAYDYISADSITVLPYMGIDSIKPFFNYKNKFVFVVALSSNKGGLDFQRTPFYNPLYMNVIKKVNQSFNNAGYVFGATRPEYIKKIRNKGIKNLLLIPGVGTQGGDVEKSIKYACLKGGKAIFNVSRGIIYAGNGNKYYQAIRKKAKEYYKILQV